MAVFTLFVVMMSFKQTSNYSQYQQDNCKYWLVWGWKDKEKTLSIAHIVSMKKDCQINTSAVTSQGGKYKLFTNWNEAKYFREDLIRQATERGYKKNYYEAYNPNSCKCN